jgi:2-amino-4-hydroxy-6-hydroxymethyldihydropteridine diphosphokinase
MMLLYLGLGSNLGQPMRYLTSGLQALLNLRNASLIAVSGIYCTKPIGGPEQDDYFNLAALIGYSGTLQQALHDCQEIELNNQRIRNEHWGPRTLDIDLLYSPGEISHSPNLEVPHPRLTERLFVLAPLLELPEADRISINTKTLQEWAALQDAQQIRLTPYQWNGADIVESTKI